MFTHPDLFLSMANDRHRELVAEADRGRLVAAVRRARRGRRHANNAAPVRGQPAGTLASCESAAVPAR